MASCPLLWDGGFKRTDGIERRAWLYFKLTAQRKIAFAVQALLVAATIPWQLPRADTHPSDFMFATSKNKKKTSVFHMNFPCEVVRLSTTGSQCC